MAKPDLTKIEEERQRLQARLAELEEAEAHERERMAAVAGRAVLAEADKDLGFKETLHAILSRHVKRNADRALFDLPKRERKKSGPQDTGVETNTSEQAIHSA
jgi:hypothetical protein